MGTTPRLYCTVLALSPSHSHSLSPSLTLPPLSLVLYLPTGPSWHPVSSGLFASALVFIFAYHTLPNPYQNDVASTPKFFLNSVGIPSMPTAFLLFKSVIATLISLSICSGPLQYFSTSSLLQHHKVFQYILFAVL